MELTRIETPTPDTVAVTLVSPGIGPGVLRGLHDALDLAQSLPGCRVVTLAGHDGVFSTGMDFSAAARDQAVDAGPFFALMRRFTSIDRIVVCVVDGQVAGGGVGLVAASDFVFATERSTFALPEALWGLMPCCVLPFLLRRIGFQRAYAMALSTVPVPASRAGVLVDELTATPMIAARRLAYRVGKLELSTVGELKRYFGALAPIPAEVEQLAVTEFTRLMDSPGVRTRLSDFAEHGRFPWER